MCGMRGQRGATAAVAARREDCHRVATHTHGCRGVGRESHHPRGHEARGERHRLRPGDRSRPQRQGDRTTRIYPAQEKDGGLMAARPAHHGHLHGVAPRGRQGCGQPMRTAPGTGQHRVLWKGILRQRLEAGTAPHRKHGHPRGTEHGHHLALQHIQHLLGRQHLGRAQHGVAHLLRRIGHGHHFRSHRKALGDAHAKSNRRRHRPTRGNGSQDGKNIPRGAQRTRRKPATHRGGGAHSNHRQRRRGGGEGRRPNTGRWHRDLGQQLHDRRRGIRGRGHGDRRTGARRQAEGKHGTRRDGAQPGMPATKSAEDRRRHHAGAHHQDGGGGQWRPSPC